MFYWFQKKSRLEKLKDQYCRLMRKSYEVSLRNREKSERFHVRAIEIRKEIQSMLKEKRGYSYE